ncbi:hypothetical protein Taro_053209 [Colocasia esculenta]|uniref:Uncharacterized protein n=1 Tax=Colocasia esculenta TaxID=4460 RepID=A0A843XLX3_COLES|nr:hypothetical protein [Colocasia esculenta]
MRAHEEEVEIDKDYVSFFCPKVGGKNGPPFLHMWEKGSLFSFPSSSRNKLACFGVLPVGGNVWLSSVDYVSFFCPEVGGKIRLPFLHMWELGSLFSFSSSSGNKLACSSVFPTGGHVSVRLCSVGCYHKTLDGIKSGTILATRNLEGIILSLSTAGGAPTRSSTTALLEVAFAGFMRFIGLWVFSEIFTKQKRMPEITAILSATSTKNKMELEDVITKTLDGIKSGTILVTCNLEGIILSLSTAGGAPTRSPMTALLEVAFAGFMRFIGLWVKRMPKITAILSATSTKNKMELEDVITKTLDDIESGTILVTCNLEGIILSLSTTSGAPYEIAHNSSSRGGLYHRYN